MTLTVVMAQIDMLLGDIKTNSQTVIGKALKARDVAGAKVIVFPELTLLGYPPEGLLLKPELESGIEQALTDILEQVNDIYIVLGYPRLIEETLFNCAGVLFNGVLIAEYNKQALSNVQGGYDTRYFEAGNAALVLDMDGIRVGLSIGDDIWQKRTISLVKEAGAQVLFNLNASPFQVESINNKEAILHQRAAEASLPILYVNYVGGKDELVYEGGSLALTSKGVKAYQAPWYEEGLHSVDLVTYQGINQKGEGFYWVEPVLDLVSPSLSIENHLYQVLVRGLTDYVNKNHYKGVILNLREGLESLLTLVIAIDALGADKVHLVIMPDAFDSHTSLDKLLTLVSALGVKRHNIQSGPFINGMKKSLSLNFSASKLDSKHSNLEARIRTLALMTLAQESSLLAISSTHKSDFFVGCVCLYGDMSGDFALLKDIYMSQVIILCLYRNSVCAMIPVSEIHDGILQKESFNELGIGELPGYTALDTILRLYREQNVCVEDIVAQTKFDAKLVAQVVSLYDTSEYKRRQAPLGVRVTAPSFDLGRRFPVTSEWQL